MSAFWCRYCYGETESGTKIEPNDPNWGKLQARAVKARGNAAAWLEMGDIYGELAASAAFCSSFAKCLDFLWKNGTTATLEAYLADRL